MTKVKRQFLSKQRPTRKIGFKTLTKKQIIDDIKYVADELGQDTVTIRDYKKWGKFGPFWVQEVFGSWSAAIEKAGLILATRRKTTKEECLQNFYILWKHLGRQPNTTEINAPPSKIGIRTYLNRFGSWGRALEQFYRWVRTHEAAGDDLGIDVPEPIPPDDILLDIRDVADYVDRRPPAAQDYIDFGAYPMKDVFRYFSFWNTACKKAGFSIPEVPELSKNDLMENFHNVWLKIGKQPSERYMDRPWSPVPAIVYRKVFGNWTEATRYFRKWIDQKGEAERFHAFLRHGNISDFELLEELKRVAGILETNELSTKDFIKYSKFQFNIYGWRFGKWSKALSLVGLKLPDRRKYSDIEAMMNLLVIWSLRGNKSPGILLDSDLSFCNRSIYRDRYGSVKNAQKKVAAWVNGKLDFQGSLHRLEDFWMRVNIHVATTIPLVGYKLYLRCLIRDRFKCRQCKAEPDYAKEIFLEVHPYIPLEKGGQLTFDNLDTLCTECYQRVSMVGDESSRIYHS